MDPLFFGAGSVANISGGDIEDFLSLSPDSELNLIGTKFSLGGTSLELNGGVLLVISDRRQVLSGSLIDGSSFSFDLSQTDPAAVTEPTSLPIAGFVSIIGWVRRRQLANE